MKLVLFEAGGRPPMPGLLTDTGVIGLGDIVDGPDSPQAAMQRLIDGFDALRPRLVELAEQTTPLPVDGVRLLPPLPWPGKLLFATGVYPDPNETTPAPLLMTLKSAESVIGPNGTVQLPDVGPSWQFVPEAELGLVIRGPAKRVAAADWRSAVFGYTCVVNVMARGDDQLGRDYWLAKADTLAPLGPGIVTADEVPDPTTLRVRSWQNGRAQQDFTLGQARTGLPQLVEFATSIMTLYTGDVLACGTRPVGLRPLADGDWLEVDIDGIGRLALQVAVLAGSQV